MLNVFRQSYDPVLNGVEIHDHDMWIKTCGVHWLTSEVSDHFIHECDHDEEYFYRGGKIYYHQYKPHRCACGAELPVKDE